MSDYAWGAVIGWVGAWAVAVFWAWASRRHRWTKWSEPRPADGYVRPLYQQRSCIKCNRAQGRSI